MENMFSMEPQELHKISADELFLKAKKLAEYISNAYSESWANRALKESEFPSQEMCEKCTGCGSFKKENGEESECFQDKIEGYCYHRFVDYENFGIEIESVMEDVWDLSSIDEIEKQATE